MSNNLSNENDFDKDLKKIGDCYEEIKEGLHMIDSRLLSRNEINSCYKALQELRDIAAMQLKKNHVINEN